MSFSIAKLFKAKAAPDGLTQTQREAIADLLHYCMYADRHIALVETQTINDVINAMSWDPRTSFESFEARSIGAARGANDDPKLREAFLRSVRERLDDANARALAIKVCRQLFVADGVQSEKESLLLAQLTKLLA